MKFTFAANQTQHYLLQGIGSLRRTWEYRTASAAVILQGILGVVTIAWSWRHLPPAVPLWYSRPWGEDRLASPWFLFLPIGTAILIYSINLIAVTRIGVNHPMFARVLFITSLLVSCLSIVLIIRIVSLVR